MLLLMLVSLVAWSALGATALAGAASQPQAEVKIKGASQKKLLKKGLKVKISTEDEGRIEVKAK